MKLILGSRSRWRQQILKETGFDFDIMNADIDEKAIRDKDPEKLVLKIAKAKADVLLQKIKEPAILVTLDQVVVCNNEIFEKPTDEKEARYFMESYNCYPAKTVTGIVVTNTQTKKQASGVDTAEVFFCCIDEGEIKRQIDRGEIFHCAGGFQIEGKDNQLNPYIKAVNGDIDSVKGLPMKLLRKLFEQL